MVRVRESSKSPIDRGANRPASRMFSLSNSADPAPAETKHNSSHRSIFRFKDNPLTGFVNIAHSLT